MANVFDAPIMTLQEAGEPLSAIIFEFAAALDDREIAQLIMEIAEVQKESEPRRSYDDDDEEEEGP